MHTPLPSLLSSSQQYRYELSQVAITDLLSDEDEHALLERVRAGDKQARETMILYLMACGQRMTTWLYRVYQWKSHRIEYLDMLQQTNEALLVCFERALTKDNPMPYLLGCMRYAAWKYCRCNGSLILNGEQDDPIKIASLAIPIGEDLTLFDVLCDTLVDGEGETQACSDEQKQWILQEALAQLSHAERLVIEYHYGLGTNARPLATIAHEQGWTTKQTNYLKARALLHLHEVLTQTHAPYAHLRGAMPVQQGFQSSHQTWAQAAHASTEREARLATAYDALLTQRGKVTVWALAEQAHVDSKIATHYIKTRQGPRLSLQERLERAYQVMLARGAKITARTLRDEAGTGRAYTQAFLKQKLECVAA